MQDTYRTCPISIDDDERLSDDVADDVKMFAERLVLRADDWGRVDGDASFHARYWRLNVENIERLYCELERIRFIVRYVPSGKIRKVAEIVGYHDMPGQPERVRYITKRNAAVHPERDGFVIPGREARLARKEWIKHYEKATFQALAEHPSETRTKAAGPHETSVCVLLQISGEIADDSDATFSPVAVKNGTDFGLNQALAEHPSETRTKAAGPHETSVCVLLQISGEIADDSDATFSPVAVKNGTDFGLNQALTEHPSETRTKPDRDPTRRSDSSLDSRVSRSGEPTRVPNPGSAPPPSAVYDSVPVQANARTHARPESAHGTADVSDDVALEGATSASPSPYPQPAATATSQQPQDPDSEPELTEDERTAKGEQITALLGRYAYTHEAAGTNPAWPSEEHERISKRWLAKANEWRAKRKDLPLLPERETLAVMKAMAYRVARDKVDRFVEAVEADRTREKLAWDDDGKGVLSGLERHCDIAVLEADKHEGRKKQLRAQAYRVCTGKGQPGPGEAIPELSESVLDAIAAAMRDKSAYQPPELSKWPKSLLMAGPREQDAFLERHRADWEARAAAKAAFM